MAAHAPAMVNFERFQVKPLLLSLPVEDAYKITGFVLPPPLVHPKPAPVSNPVVVNCAHCVDPVTDVSVRLAALNPSVVDTVVPLSETLELMIEFAPFALGSTFGVSDVELVFPPPLPPMFAHVEQVCAVTAWQTRYSCVVTL